MICVILGLSFEDRLSKIRNLIIYYTKPSENDIGPSIIFNYVCYYTINTKRYSKKNNHDIGYELYYISSPKNHPITSLLSEIRLPEQTLYSRTQQNEIRNRLRTPVNGETIANLPTLPCLN